MSVAGAIGVLFYLRYEITRERHAEIISEISHKKNSDVSVTQSYR